ncbi:MAG TPA: hypothetical protein VIM34_02845 [Burkholderiaceae bacterium]
MQLLSASSGALTWLRTGSAVGIAVLAVSAHASLLLFDRGLPTANLNNASGAIRSKVAWADTGLSTVSIGDNFTLTGSNTVNDIRVWVITNSTGLSTNAFQLWLGTDTGAITVVNSTSFSTSVVSTTYAGGSLYQGSSGNFRNIYQVDFSGLALSLGAGTYAFGVSGAADSGLTTPFLSASNGPLSGSTQMGDDGVIYGFTAAGAMDTANGYP